MANQNDLQDPAAGRGFCEVCAPCDGFEVIENQPNWFSAKSNQIALLFPCRARDLTAIMPNPINA